MEGTVGEKVARIFLLFFVIVFLILDCVAVSVIVKTVPIGETEYETFEEFCEAGATGYKYMPSKAIEQKYYLNYMGLSTRSIYSFRVEDKKDYKKCMEDLKAFSCTETAAAHPAWDWYEPYNPTAEELEQMNYVQANYKNMSFQEVLDYSRMGKGFANGYGASVIDFMDLEYSLGNFPRYMDFEAVVPDEIETYTVLYYRPFNTGTSCEGVLVNEATRRFVIFYCANAR